MEKLYTVAIISYVVLLYMFANFYRNKILSREGLADET